MVEAGMRATRTYLQMMSPSELRPVHAPAGDRIVVQRVDECALSFFRYLYREVGRAYHWVDRLPWTDEQIRDYLGDPGVSLWLLTAGGGPAGYFELKREEDGAVEIAYFGLLPDFIGRKLGGYLLTAAVERAWELGATRVWLHTCTLDHPAAMRNYVARGFAPFKQEEYDVPLAS